MAHVVVHLKLDLPNFNTYQIDFFLLYHDRKNLRGHNFFLLSLHTAAHKFQAYNSQ